MISKVEKNINYAWKHNDAARVINRLKLYRGTLKVIQPYAILPHAILWENGKIDPRQFARYITLCNITLCNITLYNITLCNITSCNIMEKWKNRPATVCALHKLMQYYLMQYYRKMEKCTCDKQKKQWIRAIWWFTILFSFVTSEKLAWYKLCMKTQRRCIT